MNRPSSRCTTRCSRCRCTTSSSIVPGSSKTTGRIGDTRRHSQGFWSRARGTRSVSIVSAQVGSAPSRWSRAGRASAAGSPSVVASCARLQRLGSDQLQRAGDRRAEMLLVQADAIPADLPAGSRSASICLRQGILPLACRFQLFLDGLPPVGIEVGRFDFVFEGVDLVAANALLERVGAGGRRSPGPGCPAPS